MPLPRPRLFRHAPRHWFARVLAALFVAVALWPGFPAPLGSAEPRVYPEYQVKAMMLLNFARFIEWPEDAFTNAAAPFVVGVPGRDPFGADLDRVFANKQVQKRPVVIRRMTTEREWRECHLLFLPPSERKRQREILENLKSLPVLAVGETDDFMDMGGGIQFILRQDSTVQFAVNLDAAKPARLKFSASLLKLADKVRGRYD